MTTEDDFQRALDADPADYQTRLVFADWLDERNDPRAAGYRALGVLRRSPHHVPHPRTRLPWLFVDPGIRLDIPGNYSESTALPDDWYAALPRFPNSKRYAEEHKTRRAAEDAAALAFARLPAARRAELLAGEGAVP